MRDQTRQLLSSVIGRRRLLKGLAGASLAAGVTACAPAQSPAPIFKTVAGPQVLPVHQHSMPFFSAEGVVQGMPEGAPPPIPAGRTPAEILTSFQNGRVSTLANGRVLREYTLVTSDVEIEVAPGVTYPAWSYNGTVPGPTLRCTVGDRIKVYFFNGSAHPHTIHFHGIHPANMDGVFEQVPPGSSFVYEFDAEPFGLFPYHCHTMPVKKHIEKGLYGTLIVDPPTPRPPATEMVMVMNGFDTDVDGENEFYTINGFANYFVDQPIPVKLGELIRVYLVNMTEFDLVNSFHLHGNMFKLFRTGTSLDHFELTDTVTLGQGERSILEFSFKYPGKYMFHAHQSEFSELGWMGFFDVTE